MKEAFLTRIFKVLTSSNRHECADIPGTACEDQPKNFLKHVSSLSMTKTSDKLIDPKLVLSWLLSTLGASGFFVGLLVPVREAGALLPQLFTSGYISSLSQRKWAWAIGSFLQGLCAIGIAIASLALTGRTLGIAIVSILSLLALARSICSVSYKDVLGKTVDKSNRGTATGTANSIAAGFIIIYALIMTSGIFDKMSLIVVGLFTAAVFWLLAGCLFLTLTEEKSPAKENESPITEVFANFQYLRDDRQLQLFILTRGMLTATALAPPFIVALSVDDMKSVYGGLGLLILASSGASLCSSYIWGKLADRSSRKVLIYSGLVASASLFTTSVLAFYQLTALPLVLPALLFSLMIAYQGVRLGRSTHLVDMTGETKRAAYTALSNTIIGILLLAGGAFSLIAQFYGEILVITLLASMSLVSILTAYHLEEVQQ